MSRYDSTLMILLREFAALPDEVDSNDEAYAYMKANHPGELQGFESLANEINGSSLLGRHEGLDRLRLAEIDRALGDLLMWINSDGSPCDGFRFRETALNARRIFNQPTTEKPYAQMDEA